MNAPLITPEYLHSRGIATNHATFQLTPLEYAGWNNVPAERRVQVLLHQDFVDERSLNGLCDTFGMRHCCHRYLFLTIHQRAHDLTQAAMQQRLDAFEIRDMFFVRILTAVKCCLHYDAIEKTRATFDRWAEEAAAGWAAKAGVQTVPVPVTEEKRYFDAWCRREDGAL